MLTVLTGQSYIDALLIQEGVDQVFKLLRVQVVAGNACQSAHRGFKVSALVFGIFDTLLDVLGGVALSLVIGAAYAVGQSRGAVGAEDIL